MTYNARFYDAIRDGVRSSAAVVVPVVMWHLGPRSVVDVGCGEGWWAAEFARNGCDVLGIDGAHVDPAPGVPFTAHDLELPLAGFGHHDLAVCLEVAEHLSPGRASGFVGDLCQLADVVLFSAAIPGQGGAGHVNEQPASYWVGLFEQRGYAVSGALRWEIWDDTRVACWYRQNLLVAAKGPRRTGGLFSEPLAPPWDVVHPDLFDARRVAR